MKTTKDRRNATYSEVKGKRLHKETEIHDTGQRGSMTYLWIFLAFSE